MNKIIAFCTSKWFIQLLIITVLALLIWFFGALLAFADHKPLQSEIARLLTILVMVVLWGLNNLRTQHKNHQDTTPATVNESTNVTKSKVSNNVIGEENTLNSNFNAALTTLKSMQTGKHSIYELPWYLVIGAEGSGKTNVLINSGLEFPLSNKLNKLSVNTEDCTWWFTDHAVLLDTAGRYSTQTNDSGWISLLKLLNKYRPRRPINGVLITMSVANLLNQSPDERRQYALSIRTRIEELYTQFGIRVPLYMLWTKTDLIAGFNDYFATLSKEERTQVWGITFPYNDEDYPLDITANVGKDFDALLSRLNERLAKRLQEERDLQRRQAIFGFPQRMALLKEPLLSFLQEAFGANRYQQSAYLRGIYFTSSVQIGTPIDRLMERFADIFRLDRFSVLPMSGSSKPYFINRLFNDIIFKEALLVGFNQRIERLQTLLRLGTYSSAALLTLLMTDLWFTSYTNNQTLLAEFDKKIQQYETTAVAYPIKKIDFSALLQRMNAMQNIVNVYAKEPDWSMTLGLYQGDNLQSLANDSYQQLLQKQFLPMITASLEQRLSSTEASNPEVHYQLLKVYLMLGDPKKLEAGLVRLWLAANWEKNYPLDVQTQLLGHLNNLLKLPPEVQTLNQRLIAASRQVLTRIPIAQQLYMRVKSEALQDASKDFQLSTALAPNGERVFVPIKGSWTQQTIPYLYTYDGFYQVFLKQSKNLAEQSIQQNWVLGDTVKTENLDVDALAVAMQNYYDRDYIQYWDGLLANLTIKSISNLQQATEVLEFASAADSPIRQLLITLDKQTALTRKPPGALDKLEAVADKHLEKLLDTAKVGDTPPQAELGSAVEQHFQPLTALLKAAAGGAAPLDQTIASLGQLYGYVIDLSNPAKKGDAAVKVASQANGDAVAKMKLETARLPEPLKSLTQALTSDNLTVILSSGTAQLNQLWITNVLPLYDSGLAWRYPFWRTSVKEVAIQDFGRFFAKNGILDKFFDTNLKAFVDTTDKDWKLIKQDDKGLTISEAALLQFQYAEKIRQVFFSEGGTMPLVRFSIKPVSLDANANKFWLNIEGQKVEFQKNAEKKSVALQWPGTDGSRAVSFGFEMSDGKKKTPRQRDGAWAWFRVLDEANMQDTGRDSYLITFDIDGVQASYELTANSIDNPFSLKELSSINLPLSL
jgi:type VI secretion system protein ImpL